MKLSLAKDNIRTIFKNIKRYFVIILIVFLGSCIFSGFTSVIPDLKSSLGSYYDMYNLMDLKIISSNGLSDDEIDTIKNTEGIYEVSPSVSSDVTLNYKDNDYTLTLESLPDSALFNTNENYINRLDLTEGNLPTKRDQCVLSKEMASSLGISVGDIIDISNCETTVFDDLLNFNEYTVVGIADSPMYTYLRQRHLTGQNYGSIYVPLQGLNYSAYTECYATISDSSPCFEDKYEDTIKDFEDIIKKNLEDDVDHDYYSNMKQMGINVEEPKYYTTGRQENLSFQLISQDISILKGLASVLPIIFFLVASLVSLTSTSRLVDETRSQIGILKALGYNDNHVSKKYLLYSISASIIGSILGVYVGTYYLTKVIFFVYTTSHFIKEQHIDFQLLYAILSIAISVLCVAFATISSCRKAVQEYIYKLMRPKTPPIGKKILLEKITPLWKRFNFMQKVTTRNLFRYKKRLVMTILGISGCTAILIAGFSTINQSTSIMQRQYNNVFKYDLEISLKSKNYSDTSYDDLDDFLHNINGVNGTLLARSEITNSTSDTNTDGENVQLIVLDKDINIDNFISLHSPNGKENYTIPDTGIIITQKLSKLLNVSVGDKIKLDKTEDSEIEITNIVENYYNNYVYMSKNYYTDLIKDDFYNNKVFVTVADEPESNIDAISDKCKDNDMVSQVSKVSDTLLTFSKSMDSLKSVLLLIILFSGSLAFTVLYNLSILNISERLRELATLKVLGFREKEVLNYVSRENNVLTIFGVICGVLAGYVLSLYVLQQCETDLYMFNKSIDFGAYFYSITLTLVFSIIVNKLSQSSLKRIDMIDSLKSVE